MLLLFIKLCNVASRFSQNMLFELFLTYYLYTIFMVPVVNTNDHVWFLTIKAFNPSRLEFIICIMVSNIKIFSWFKLNTFLNIETTTSLNWWSSVTMVVLVALQFPWFNFTFCYRGHVSDTAITLKLNSKLLMNASRFSRSALSEQVLVWKRLKNH